MKKALLLLASAAIALSASAQDRPFFSMDQKGGGFYVTSGIYASNIGSQYDKLGLDDVAGNDSADLATRDAVSYPKLSNTLYSIGIGGFGCRSNILFGGEANFYLGSSKSASFVDSRQTAQSIDRNYTLKSSALGADVLGTIGIVAVRKSGLVIAPILGLGYGGMSTVISDSRDQRQYPIYAPGNQENKYLYNASFVFDLGLGVDYYMGGDEDRAKGFRLGVKVGYRNQFAGDWIDRGDKFATSYKGQAFEPVSKLGSNGLYVKLVLGIGTIGAK